MHKCTCVTVLYLAFSPSIANHLHPLAAAETQSVRLQDYVAKACSQPEHCIAEHATKQAAIIADIDKHMRCYDDLMLGKRAAAPLPAAITANYNKVIGAPNRATVFEADLTPELHTTVDKGAALQDQGFGGVHNPTVTVAAKVQTQRATKRADARSMRAVSYARCAR